MNRKIKLSEKEKNLVVNEILEKVKFYEQKMTTRLARWVEIAELYCGKTATQKENSKNSPNSPELYKAIRAIANMQMRMLLGQKPPFELEPNDILGYDVENNQPDWSKLIKLEHYIQEQLDLSKFPKNLYRALTQLLLYGSVACLEQYEPMRSSFLGRKKYVTTFRPISLVNCAFSLDAYDIEESSWVALSDIQSNRELQKLLNYDEKGEIYNIDEIKKAQEDVNYRPIINNWVQQRLAWQGYIGSNFQGGIERIIYYGPLDCLNDISAEYCIEIVNRKFVIRSEEYDGIRPVRIATINTIDVEPLGNGLGDMFRPLLAKIDDTESSLLNMITLAGANMYAKQKAMTDEDIEFTIRNFGILSLENPNLVPITPAPQNLQAVAAYNEKCVQQFRQASGATDTLQALVAGEQATATAVSLAMNESVRNISVQSELVAPVLLTDHIKVILQNAQKYQKEPIVVNINKTPITMNPSEFMLDVNVRVKVTTDQDFRPARQQRLREAIQLMLTAPPNAIPGKRVNAGPAILEYLKTLDVPNWDKSIQNITEEDLFLMRLLSEINNPSNSVPNAEMSAQEERAAGERIGRKEQRELNRNMSMPMNTETMKTPVGEVLAVPGDETARLSTIRKSTVGKG